MKKTRLPDSHWTNFPVQLLSLTSPALHMLSTARKLLKERTEGKKDN